MKRNKRKIRRSKRARKMTPAALRKFVMTEAAKLTGKLEDVSKVKAKEVDASEYADTLEKDVDMYKAMKVQEAKLLEIHQNIIREARKIRRNKRIAKKRILRRLK